MTILLILLILVFLMVILSISCPVMEPFQNASSSWNPVLQTMYDPFVRFYNGFLVNWEKAITTAVSQEVEQQPLTSPTDTSNRTAPTVSRIQQNQYITKLSQQLNVPLPFITDALPSSIEPSSVSTILSILPNETRPFHEALQWMNTQLVVSQEQVGEALKGIPVTMEAFQNQCGDVSQCLLQNQDFINKVREEVYASGKQKEEETQKKQEDELIKRLSMFQKDTKLQQQYQSNLELVQQADTLKSQAESGEILKQVEVPDRPVAIGPMPKGGLALSEMEQKNPEQYNQLKQNNPSMFQLKQLLEQINRSL
jgi:hypothetical protein